MINKSLYQFISPLTGLGSLPIGFLTVIKTDDGKLTIASHNLEIGEVFLGTRLNEIIASPVVTDMRIDMNYLRKRIEKLEDQLMNQSMSLQSVQKSETRKKRKKK